MSSNAKAVLEELLAKGRKQAKRIETLLQSLNQHIEDNKNELNNSPTHNTVLPKELHQEIQNLIDLKIRKLPLTPETNSTEKKRPQKQRERNTV